MTTAIWTKREQQLKKLDEARIGLKDKIKHWRKEWQEEITKWSDKIFPIPGREGVCTELIFPAGHGTEFLAAINDNVCDDNSSTDHKLVASNQNIFSYTTGSFGQHNFPLPSLICGYARGVKMVTPINLLVEAIEHFVSALTGNEIVRNPNNPNNAVGASGYKFYNWKMVPPQHYNPVFDGTEFAMQANADGVMDGWMKTTRYGDYVNGHFTPSYRLLLDKLRRHQALRMMEAHFQWLPGGIQGTGKLLQSAITFFDTLQLVGGGISTSISTKYCADVPSSVNISLQIVRYGNADYFKALIYDFTNFAKCVPDYRAKLFSFDLTNPNNEFNRLRLLLDQANNTSDADSAKFASLIENLTVSDIDFIVRTYVETRLSSITIAEEIKTSNATDASFPTLDDHFSDFDIPHLRGALSNTHSTRKLIAYDYSVKLLREQTAMMRNLPRAVLNLMGSYLPLHIEE